MGGTARVHAGRRDSDTSLDDTLASDGDVALRRLDQPAVDGKTARAAGTNFNRHLKSARCRALVDVGSIARTGKEAVTCREYRLAPVGHDRKSTRLNSSP